MRNSIAKLTVFSQNSLFNPFPISSLTVFEWKLLTGWSHINHYKIIIICRKLMNSQQTRNHFWTSWYMSYCFIIGTAPPVCVFMCIHVNTHVLPVVTSLTRVVLGQNWYGFTGTWKTRGFMENMCRYTKFVHRIRWIHVNWTRWTREFTYWTCEITGRCWLGCACVVAIM